MGNLYPFAHASTGREMLKLPVSGVTTAKFTADGRYLVVQTLTELMVLDAGPDYQIGPTFDSSVDLVQPERIAEVPEPAEFSIPKDLKKSISSQGGDYMDLALGVTYFIPEGVTIRPAELFSAEKIRSLPRGQERKNMFFDAATDEVDFISVMKFYEDVPQFTVENASRLTAVGAATAFSQIDYQGKPIPLFELNSNSNGRTRIFAAIIRLAEESYMIHILGASRRETKLKAYLAEVLNSIRPSTTP